MASVFPSAIPDERAGASKATSSSRPYQRQMGTDTERGQSLALGMCRLALAVDHAQDWPAWCRAGIKAPTLHTYRGLLASGLSHSHRLASLPSRTRAFRGSLLLPDNRGARTYSRCLGLQARGALFPCQSTGCNPVLAQSLAHQQTVNSIADVPHFPNVLSSSAVSVGIYPNENGLTHAQAFFAPGAKTYD